MTVTVHRKRGGPTTRRSLVALIALVMSCAVAAGGCLSRDVLTVNGRGIPSEEFSEEVERRLSIIKDSNPQELDGERGKRLTEETERQVATELIRNTLMEEQAKELGVEVTEEDMDRLLEAERAGKGPDEFEEGLKAQGLTAGEYRDKLKSQLLVDALGETTCGDVTVAVDEAESFYLTNKDLFRHTTMIHAAHILLETEGQAKMVAEEVKEGTQFEKLAKSLSTDDATRKNSGDLGWIEQGTMEPAFEEVAFSLESGQVSGVVAASDGYHIIKVLDRREAYTPPFADVRGEAAKMLEGRRKEEKFSDWLRTVYANARVELPAALGRWDPILGMVVAG